MLGLVLCLLFFIVGAIKLASDTIVALYLFFISSVFYLGYSIYYLSGSTERFVIKILKAFKHKEKEIKDLVGKIKEDLHKDDEDDDFDFLK